MKIIPIKNSNNKIYQKPFKAKIPRKKPAQKLMDTVTTEIPLQDSSITQNLHTKFKNTDSVLKKLGITNCNIINGKISINAGYNGGYYTFDTTIKGMDSSFVKEYILNKLTSDDSAIGGIVNYIDLVKSIKRQDIVQKGLQIHSFNMNTSVSKKQTINAILRLKQHTNHNINLFSLFFVGEDAFYYDQTKKTAYITNLSNCNVKNMTPPIRECQFIVNEKGNAIGFVRKEWDLFQRRYVNYTYKEQQSPSVKLKPLATFDNTKELAEAFRFGNTPFDGKYKKSVQNAFAHLSSKLNLHDLTEKDIQIIKFVDSNNDIQTRICYYDSSIGNSFVYDKSGKYMYQLEYNKDFSGNIISFAKC